MKSIGIHLSMNWLCLYIKLYKWVVLLFLTILNYIYNVNLMIISKMIQILIEFNQGVFLIKHGESRSGYIKS